MPRRPDSSRSPAKPRKRVRTLGDVRKRAITKLQRLGIKTTADLDAWIRKNPTKDGSLTSRFGALKKLVGENAATWMIHDLSFTGSIVYRSKLR